jgi:glycosyltransferase involved in cell wall biosynthesis
MLSVIIATLDSERALVPTLAALVPGATTGLIREVLIADAGSQDETAVVADIAGCNFLALEEPLGRRLRFAADQARSPWLLFLRPGTVLDTPWIAEARNFTEQPLPSARAAVFRRATPAQSGLREAFSLFAAALGATPRPQQGLIIAKDFYHAIGGHSAHAREPEADLLRRIGRRRTVKFSTSAFSAPHHHT